MIGTILTSIVCGMFSVGFFAAVGINRLDGKNEIAVLCLVAGTVALALPYALFCLHLQSRWLGKAMSPNYLDTETIYTVCGRIEATEDKTIVALKDSKGKTRCVEISQSLRPGTQHVRKVFLKTGKKTAHGIPLAEVRLEPANAI